MRHRLRPFLILTLILITGLSIWSRTQATDRDLIFTGYAQINGPLMLEVSASPPISTPGDTLTIQLHLTNQTKVTYSPDVSLVVPSGLRLTQTVFPAGVTYNVQTNTLSWLPVAVANGGTQSLSVAFRVETADIANPEKAIHTTLRYDNEEKSTDATIWIGMPPQIRTVSAQSQVSVGQSVQLTADISGPGPITQHWDLGDGRRVDVNNPQIVYPAAGIYKVVLAAENPLSSVTRGTNISVVPHPAAQFVLDDDNPSIGQPINITNQSGGQPPLVYNWDFGDGTSSTETSPSHLYAAPGLYQIRLSLQNGFGQSEAFWMVRVGDTPIADMMIDDGVPVGLPVTGQAFGDDTVTTFRWDMGDGRFHEGEQISHIYQQEGDYYVLVQAINEFGSTEIGRWIHINPGQLSTYLPYIAKAEVIVAQSQPIESFDDGSGLVLEPVALDGTFVLEAADLPENTPYSEQLFYYINETRRQFGLPPLNFVYELSAIAQQHTDDMAAYHYTAHVGSDGSTPPERFLYYGYPHGYAGEATAWGFPQAYEAVAFWVNSPGHRRIILNRYATDVGVAFTADYTAPNVWYWTAEFGNAFDVPPIPELRVQAPDPYIPPTEEEEQVITETLITDLVAYRWNWSQPLTADQQFVVYIHGSTGSVRLGVVAQPTLGTEYRLVAPAYDTVKAPGLYEWEVRLETVTGSVLAAGERRAINFAPDPTLLPTVTPTAVPVTPSPTPTATPTAIPWPTPTLLPPPPTLPPLGTATPNP
jgi:uncharacterized protein YkwD